MLEFLDNLGNFATNASGTLNSVAGPIQKILNAIRKPKTNVPQYAPTLRDQIINMATNFPQSEAEAQSLDYLRSLADPNNDLVNSLSEEELRNLQSGMQSDIRSKVLADRRERSMGRAPVFFDPERADENISYQISRGTPMLKNQAHQNAIQRILQASGVGKFAANADARNQGNLNALASVYTMDSLSPSGAGPPNTGVSQLQPNSPGLLGRAQSGITGLQQILKIFQQNQPAYFPPGQTGYGPYKPPPTLNSQISPYASYNQMRYNG